MTLIPEGSAVPSLGWLLSDGSRGCHSQCSQGGAAGQGSLIESRTSSLEASFGAGSATGTVPAPRRMCLGLPRGSPTPDDHADGPSDRAELGRQGWLLSCGLTLLHGLFRGQQQLSRRCSLDCPWAVNVQVAAAPANGK